MLYTLFRTVALLPFRALYLLADIIAWLAHSVVRYRRKVVRHNLASSFPEMDKRTLRRTERDFYRFLADYFVETIKLSRISDAEMSRRMRFRNMESVNAALDRGQCVSLFLGHYCNWEWVSSMPLHLTRKAHACQIYHRLRDAASDRAFLRLRSRFGATCVPMDESLTTLMRDYRAGRPNITGYIADQAPKYASLHHFVPFLHHDTAVLTGTERLSRMVHARVFYCHMTRPRRGYYVCTFEEMTPDAATMPKFALTDLYWQMLERDIIAHPPYWLWSHRRWKHTLDGLKRHYPDDWQRRLTRL